MMKKGIAPKAILLIALMLIPVGVTVGQEEPQDVTAPATPKESNYLEVDALTGTTVTYIYNGVEETSVRITGVSAGLLGFHLIDPYNVKVWKDQVSTSTGFVEFWYTRLIAGEYKVVRTDALGIDLPVTIFSPPTELTNSPINLCGFFTSVGTGYQRTSSDNQWVETPLMILHAPYKGSSSANSGGGSSKSIYVFPFGWESTVSHSTTLTTTNGETIRFFRTAKWGIYTDYTYTCGGTVENGRTAKVYEWGNIWNTKPSWGNSRTTDADDVETWCNEAGTSCVTVKNRYRGADHIWRADCPSGSSTTREVSGNVGLRVGGSVSVGAETISADAFEVKAGWFKDYRYTYTVPCGDTGQWYVDELPDPTSGWAFRYSWTR